MSFLITLQNWAIHSDNAETFINHVLNPSNGQRTPEQLKPVDNDCLLSAKYRLRQKVYETYKLIYQHLKEHRYEINPSHEGALKRLKDNVTKLKFYAMEQKLERLEKAQIKTEAIIKFLQKKYNLTYKRAKFPITPITLQKQGWLHQSLRETRPWLISQNKIEPFKDFPRRVYRLFNSTSDKIVAYYKESSDLIGIMEPLMWQTAVIMGMESFFIPTSTFTLKTQEEMKTCDQEKIKTSNSLGNEPTIENVSTNNQHVGSFQPALTSVSLYDYSQGLHPEIPYDHLMSAVLVSSVMGFFDAHRHNILIDEQGHINFFDNMRSMPHSNGCILWGESETLRCSFRSGLITLMDCQKHLSQKDRQFLASELHRYKTKFRDLERFYNSPCVQSKIKKLPESIFEAEDCLHAMWERIENLEKAIQNPKIKTLCDLSLASQPNLRFFHAIICIKYLASQLPSTMQEGDYLYCMDMIGEPHIEECVGECCKLGFDLTRIKKWCENPEYSFNSVMKKIYSHRTRIEIKKALVNGEKILDEVSCKAKADYKDAVSV